MDWVYMILISAGAGAIGGVIGGEIAWRICKKFWPIE